MAYTLDFSLALGSSKAGLADLRAQLVDTAGGNVGSAISTGFTEIGGGRIFEDDTIRWLLWWGVDASAIEPIPSIPDFGMEKRPR